MSKYYIIIPARYESTRFPGKPLLLLKGKPMIQWVYEAAKGVKGIDGIYVATDDARINEAVLGFGGQGIMTSSEHQSGSDRLAECINILNLDDDDVVLNIQGDEPLIKPEMIMDLLNTMKTGTVMGTLKEEIRDEDDINNPNIVKVITDINDDAIYFSRCPLPYMRNKQNDLKYYRHVGVYGYKVSFLKMFSCMPKTLLERSESLEQLRVIENGFKIKVKETKFHSLGIDTPDQVSSVEALL